MDISPVKDIAGLNEWLGEHNLHGFWQTERGRRDEYKPFLWKWEDMHAALTMATQIVSMDDTGIQTGRRNIGLTNPRMGGRRTGVIGLGLQCLLPGEVARAHRHTLAAIRFVVEGSAGAYTVVEGEPMPMEAGDLITTPSWTWHDHYNEGTEPAIWLDGLDVGMSSLAQSFREDFPVDQQLRDKPVGLSSKIAGATRPSWPESPYPTAPYRYTWKDTSASLEALKAIEEPNPYDGYHLQFRNPATGGSTLPTVSCEMQLFTPGQKTKLHRRNCTTIYHVFRGSGVTTVGGERLEWSRGDMFVVPPWLPHEHANPVNEDAILFSFSDWPTIKALGWYREEQA